MSRTLAALLLLSGCSQLQSNYLDGSLGEVFDLSFDQTRVRLYDSELAVEYTDSGRQGLVVLRVTLRRDDDLGAGVRYDLFERGDVGHSDTLGAELPPLDSGRLRFGELEMRDGGVARGSFRAVFDTLDGSKLTAFGGFDTELELVAR